MSELRPKTRPSDYKDIFLFHSRIINAWRPQTEVLAFRYGDDVLGSVCAFGSIFITFMFRKALKLRPYAKMTCYLPVVGLSSLGCFTFHNVVIDTDIVAEKCSLCVLTKANISQLMFGVGYPLLSAATVCFYMADKLLTYPVPPLARAPREVFTLFQKIILKSPRSYLALGAIHMIAASFITLQKQKTLKRLELKLQRS